MEEEGWCRANGMRRARWCSMSEEMGAGLVVDVGGGEDEDAEDVEEESEEVDSVRSAAVDGWTCCLYWNSRAGVVFALALKLPVVLADVVGIVVIFVCRWG